jgi:hypothetical protein
VTFVVPRFRPPLAAVAAVLFVVAACSGGTPSPAPSAAIATSGASSAPTARATASPRTTAAPTTPATAAPTAATSGASASGEPTITTIDWGTIWEALPPAFPHYPGSRPTVDGGGPASAIVDLPADGPTASSWYQAALKTAGFTIVSATGPREDGSFDIVATKGPADCETEINLAPLAATTTATIYLAAACPFG